MSTSLILPSHGMQHTRRLCLRNPTRNHIAIKIRPSDSSAAQLQSTRMIIGAGKYAAVDVKITASRAKQLSLTIYARAVVEANRADLARWCKQDGGERSDQLVTLVSVRVDSRQYSAHDLIIDLPGAASMVEGVCVPVRGIDAADTRTCINIVDDCVTAAQLDARDVAVSRPRAVAVPSLAVEERPRRPSSAPAVSLPEQERCWWFGPLLDLLFPPIQPAPATVSTQA